MSRRRVHEEDDGYGNYCSNYYYFLYLSETTILRNRTGWLSTISNLYRFQYKYPILFSCVAFSKFYPSCGIIFNLSMRQ